MGTLVRAACAQLGSPLERNDAPLTMAMRAEDAVTGVAFRRVAAAIYPAPFARTLRGLSRAVLLILLFVAGAGLSLIRTPRSQWNVLWAEDGAIFASGALNDSWLSLVQPYAGYSHLVPRILAFAVSWVPLEVLPAAITIAAGAATSALALVCFVLLESRIAAVPLRLAVWISCIALPVIGGDVPNNLANLHWYLLITSFCILMSASTSRKVAVVQGFVILGAVGSDALGLLLLPFFLLRWWLLPARRDRGVVIAALVGGCLQVMAVVGGLIGTSASRELGQVHPSLGDFIGVYSTRVALGGTVGISGAEVAWLWLGVAAAIVALIVVLLLLSLACWIDARRRWGIIFFFGGSVAAAIVIYYVQWYAIADAPLEMVPSGMRYSVVPSALLMIALLLAVDALVDRAPGRFAQRAIAVAALAIVIVPTAIDVRYSTPRQDHWPWRDRVVAARETCDGVQALDAEVNLGTSPTWFGGMQLDCAAISSR